MRNMLGLVAVVLILGCGHHRYPNAGMQEVNATQQVYRLVARNTTSVWTSVIQVARVFATHLSLCHLPSSTMLPSLAMCKSTAYPGHQRGIEHASHCQSPVPTCPLAHTQATASASSNQV